MCANTGWDFDTVLDTMTFPRLRALQEEWRIRPPTHWLVAAYVKYKPKPNESLEPPKGIRIADLQAAFPGGRL